MPIPLILVVGPTASGKSVLAATLAARLGGEVVSADAMAVYRSMDIGTAKPSAEELALAPHHLVSVLEPEDRCDVSRWLGLAETAIADIHRRKRTVVICGGSPLYTKALLEGLSAGAPRDEDVRAGLNARYDRDGAEALFVELRRVDPIYAAQRHANDRKRVVRALEVHALTGRPYSSFHTTDGVRRPDYRSLQIGLQWDREVLHQRINARAKAMFAAGLVDEVRALVSRLSPEARQAVGYKEVLDHLAGAYPLNEAIELVKRHSRHLAKHQLTWYRRFSDIQWLPGDAPDVALRAEATTREFLSCGTGVSPVIGGTHGRDAHATPMLRQGAYLPHLTRSGSVYAVTFRLDDSLPRHVLESWLAEHKIQVALIEDREPSESSIKSLQSERVEAFLDASHGACWLRDPTIAPMIKSALCHFDGDRYRLHAWCIMPNHVHVLVEPLGTNTLSEILHSWKSFTAKKANLLLGRTGDFWQPEYYDHLIRDESDYVHARQYILENPAKAHLHSWPWIWSATPSLAPDSPLGTHA